MEALKVTVQETVFEVDEIEALEKLILFISDLHDLDKREDNLGISDCIDILTGALLRTKRAEPRAESEKCIVTAWNTNSLVKTKAELLHSRIARAVEAALDFIASAESRVFLTAEKALNFALKGEFTVHYQGEEEEKEESQDEFDRRLYQAHYSYVSRVGGGRTLSRKPYRLFEFGRVVGTQKALDVIPYWDIQDASLRHSNGDWGEVSTDEWRANDEAVRKGGEIFSSYISRFGTEFWIITEADRSSTCILIADQC